MATAEPGCANPWGDAHAATLQVLEGALRSKRPSSWKVYELKIYLHLRGGDPSGKKEELAARLVLMSGVFLLVDHVRNEPLDLLLLSMQQSAQLSRSGF